ncbi:hypothetical protein ACP70R_043000 [Stipagrostis hirtigluma subsp. patula]
MGAVRIELWIILALCLLLMPFLHGPVLGAEGNEPSTCEHGNLYYANPDSSDHRHMMLPSALR